MAKKPTTKKQDNQGPKAGDDLERNVGELVKMKKGGKTIIEVAAQTQGGKTAATKAKVEELKAKGYTVQTISPQRLFDAPSPASVAELRAKWKDALAAKDKAARVHKDAVEKVKSLEGAIVTQKDHDVKAIDRYQLQDELSDACVARSKAKGTLDTRKHNLKVAWNAYQAFEKED